MSDIPLLFDENTLEVTFLTENGEEEVLTVTQEVASYILDAIEGTKNDDRANAARPRTRQRKGDETKGEEGGVDEGPARSVQSTKGVGGGGGADGARKEGEAETGWDVGVLRELCDELLCCVCNELVIEPVTLTCGHSHCRPCTLMLCRTRGPQGPKSKDGIDYLCCPLCKAITSSPHTIPINIMLRNMCARLSPSGYGLGMKDLMETRLMVWKELCELVLLDRILYVPDAYACVQERIQKGRACAAGQRFVPNATTYTAHLHDYLLKGAIEQFTANNGAFVDALGSCDDRPVERVGGGLVMTVVVAFAGTDSWQSFLCMIDRGEETMKEFMHIMDCVARNVKDAHHSRLNGLLQKKINAKNALARAIMAKVSRLSDESVDGMIRWLAY